MKELAPIDMNIVEMRYYLDWEEKKKDSTLKKYPKIARKQNGNQKSIEENVTQIKVKFNFLSLLDAPWC